MAALQAVFTNREIALGMWLILLTIALMFGKAGKEFLKSILPIIFCRKFVVFYIVFIGALIIIIRILSVIGYWDLNLLKDTIFWVLFVEVPIFANAISKAKDHRFFRRLVIENLGITAFIAFVMNFWSFDLIIEIIIVPLVVFLSALHYISSKNNKYPRVKRNIEFLFFSFVIIALYNVGINFYKNSTEFFTLSTIKTFTLPLILLILNMPIIYGLALYSTYEEIFIFLKGKSEERKKMAWRILRYGNINLAKISSMRNKNILSLMGILTDSEMAENIKKFKKYLESRMGDNYMRRATFYKYWSAIGLLLFGLGLVALHTHVGIKDILSLNFIIDRDEASKLISQLCIVGVVISVAALIASMGFEKKKYEEISQVKRIAIHGFLYCLKRQIEMLKESNSFTNPIDLLCYYIRPAYELKNECDKVISSFENLVTRWELESVQQLQLYAGILVSDVHHDKEKLFSMSAQEFIEYYDQRVKDAPQNENFNTYTFQIQQNIEKYNDQIKLATDEFKNCLD